MLEFVLMLPFIWIILVLIFDFGQALVERQRTMVAVREVAFRHSARIGSGDLGDVSGIGGEVAGDTLRVRRMSASFQVSGGDSRCPGRGPSVDESGLQQVFEKVQEFLARMSSSQVYQASAYGQPVAGRLLPQPTYSGCFAVDARPWTYAETQGYWGVFKKLVGGVFGL